MKKKFNKFLSWIIYVVFLSILPLILKILLYFLAGKSISLENISFMGDLFFFAVVVSADNFKTLTFNKFFSEKKALHNVLFFSSSLLGIFASMLYCLVILNDINSIIEKDFNLTLLKYSALIVSAAVFAIGITVQIIHINTKEENYND